MLTINKFYVPMPVSTMVEYTSFVRAGSKIEIKVTAIIEKEKGEIFVRELTADDIVKIL